jgi:hypothetical protein
MRTIVLTILALANCSVNIVAAQVPADPKPVEPTAEQLAAAKKAYGKHGVTCTSIVDPEMKSPRCYYSYLLNKTKDADLKGLPDLPFQFALDLGYTDVTDAGLKELNGLGNLTQLDLGGTKVTDAGLKELKKLKNLTQLNLYVTKVTDAGMCFASVGSGKTLRLG